MAALTFVGPTFGSSPETIADQASWENLFRPLRGDGVLFGLTPSLDASGRNAVMAGGAAFLRAYAVEQTGSNSTAIPAASGQNRIDRLVLRLDRAANTAATWIKPVVITGTAGANPQPPAIQATSDAQWDLPIARWTSASSGALTGLVDERVILGGQVLGLRDGALLPPAAGQSIGVTTTKVLASLNGSTWTTIYSDTGWQNLTVNGPDNGAWNTDGVCRVRAVNGVVRLRFAIQREGKTSLGTGDANGSTPFTLSAAFRPSVSEPGSGYSGFFNGPRKPVGVLVDTDGSVIVYAMTDDVLVGGVLAGQATYLLG